MLGGAVARRYALALYEIGTANNSLDKLVAELTSVVMFFKENTDANKILVHPRIAVEDKKSLLQQLFQSELSETASNFLSLLVERNREASLSDVVEELVEMLNRAKNIAQAEVVSAMELNLEQVEEIKQQLAKCTGKIIELSTRVDASLVGGVVVRIGDTVIDGSIKNRIKSLQEQLRNIS